MPVLHLPHLSEDRLEDKLSTSTRLEVASGCLTLLIRKLQSRTNDVPARMDESRSRELAARDALPLQLRFCCIIVAVL